MAKISSQTMLFEDMTNDEAYWLEEWVNAVVLEGTFYPNKLVEQWYTECGFNQDQRLLVMSTALPQRALLSLLRYKNNKLEEVKEELDRINSICDRMERDLDKYEDKW